MKKLAMVLLVGALAVLPTAGFAANAQTTAAKHPAKAAGAHHTTTGVVKSIDANTLVITHPGKKGHDTTFKLDPSTHRDGTVDVGSTVSVTYREEGNMLVASALMARPATHAAGKS